MAYTNGIGTTPGLGTAPVLPQTPAIIDPLNRAGLINVSETQNDKVHDGLRQADQVSFSAASSAVSGDDVRTEKVQQLQAAIASGTYSVSAGDVADKLIDSLLG